MPLSFSYSHIVLVNYFTKSDDPTQTYYQPSKLIILVLFWVEISGLLHTEGENLWLTSRKALADQKYQFFIRFSHIPLLV